MGLLQNREEMASHGDLSPAFNKLREKHQQFYLSVYTSTDAELNGYLCGGGLDLGLNEQGLEEARKLARRFKRNPLKIKKIISSPELRTIQLADIFHDEMKGKMLIYREFGDQFFGDLEGKPLDQISPQTMDLNPPRGETHQNFSSRVHQGLVRVLQEKDLCLVATHLRVAKKILEWVGLGAEAIEPGALYSIDLPAGTGKAHLRPV